MTITNPDHWKEPGWNQGPRYDKILEMIAELNTPTVPAPPTDHASGHQNGGGDEIDVGGLSGDLADLQDPKLHASAHQNGGGDEIGVGGLSGLLADGQNPLAHTLHDAHLMIGSANSTWVPCMMWMWNPASAAEQLGVTTRNLGATDFYINYRLPIPLSRGGLDLVIDQIRVGLYDADSNDYVTSIFIYTVDSYNTFSTPYSDATGWTVPAEIPSPTDISNIDCTGLRSVVITINIVATTLRDVDISYAHLKCFYA